MAMLRKALGLKEDAGEQDVCTAIQALSALQPRIVALESSVAPLVALTAADGKLTVLSVGLDGIKGKIGDLDVQGKITALSTDLDAIRKDIVCYQARIEGKVIPLSAEQLGATPLATLQEMVEKLPVTVPLGSVTPLSVREHKIDGAGVHTDADLAVAKACGVPLK